MIIGYALMLNNECHNFIREIQLELHQVIGIGLPRQTPHITIKSPFEINDIKNHVEYIEDLSLRIKPIDIEFDGFGTFGNKVIFLNVKENQELHNLHWKIIHEVKEKFNLTPHEFEGENIKFHASIAGFNNEDTFRRAYKLLSKYQPDYNFKVTELGIFYYLGEEKGWMVNRKIKIQN
jgi:2'-5' RNA ligase